MINVFNVYDFIFYILNGFIGLIWFYVRFYVEGVEIFIGFYIVVLIGFCS